MNHTKIFVTPFAHVYPFYIKKAEKKGRTNWQKERHWIRF